MFASAIAEPTAASPSSGWAPRPHRRRSRIATLDEALAKGEFFAAERDAAPRLREQMLAGSDQQKVWAEVNRYAARAAARSATGSYQAIPDKPEVQAKRKDVESCSAATSLRAPGGVAVFVGGALAGIDLFQDDSLFAREWSKLLRASAIHAYGRRIASSEEARRGCAPRWTRS